MFSEMYRVLKLNGLLIFGNDLRKPDNTSQDAIANDIGHPVFVDMNYLDKMEKTYNYKALLRKVIPQNECRDSNLHIGAYVGILQKS